MPSKQLREKREAILAWMSTAPRAFDNTGSDDDDDHVPYIAAVKAHLEKLNLLPTSLILGSVQKEGEEEQQKKKLEHLLDALDFVMQLFHCENFTGLLHKDELNGKVLLGKYSADDDDGMSHFFSAADKDGRATAEHRRMLRMLMCDGEPAHPTLRHPQLLLLAIALAEILAPTAAVSALAHAAAAASSSQTPSSLPPFAEELVRWKLRITFKHQIALVHRSHTIFVRIADCIDLLRLTSNDPKTFIEIAHVQVYYHRPDDAYATLEKAKELNELDLKEETVMGVRTRYQQNQHAQLLLHAASSFSSTSQQGSTNKQQQQQKQRGEAEDEEELQCQMPEMISGEKTGHDIFDRPRATKDAEAFEVTPLSHADRAILLGMCHNIRNMNPHRGLTTMQAQAYIDRVMVDRAHIAAKQEDDSGHQQQQEKSIQDEESAGGWSSPVWCLQAQALLVRARLEQNRQRVQERSFLQLTELVDRFRVEDKMGEPDKHHWGRADGRTFYLTAFPPHWSLLQEFARFVYGENLVKTALEYFELIQDWENIILCCTRLERRTKAESIARDRLQHDPENPMLWVALGEATREDEHLWKAWELGKHKMAAPMRSLAKMALEREKYDKVVEYFDIAVSLNPVFGGDWFSLGFAAMRLDSLARASEAFTRVCQIDPDDSYSWSNLGTTLLRQKHRRAAFNAFSQALRNNRRAWRMWVNYFTVGVELLEVSECTAALSIILDIELQRDFVPDKRVLHAFTDMALRFCKGEIESTGNDVADEVPQQEEEKKEGKPQGLPAAYSLADEVENGEQVVPLFGEIEDDKPQHHASSSHGASEEMRIRVRERYGERLKQLFLKLMDRYVTEEEIYACAAKVFGHFGGPAKSHYYQVKEMRACTQRHMWERKGDLFRRTVQALQDMATSATMENIGSPSNQQEDKQEKEKADGGEEEGEENNGTSRTVAERVEETLRQVDTVLAASKEHMEHTEEYEMLEKLAFRLKKKKKELNH